ncbi:peptidoglycan-binding domain-containing protein [Streptomyces sp. NPDC006393]|uniref:peptidoglycan-binding domain-containing protein n=1 Tax=Streptomyces sp. NPDC006393 TaxID=3156763 RepID=UPI0033EA4412
MTSRVSLAVGAALTCSALALPVNASASVPSAPAQVSRPSATPQSTASIAPRCLVWFKQTENYHGYTAGYSWAWNVTVSYGATGDRVREIQCLLDYYWAQDYPYGDTTSPGALDGNFGPTTLTAVKNFQRHRCGFGSGSDGVVGPPTWRCLRGQM